jgi:hypothetical protein
VVDLEQQTLRAGLLPGVDVVDRAHLAGGDFGLGQDGEPVLGGLGREGRLDRGGQLVAVRDPVAVGEEPRVVGVDPDRLGEPRSPSIIAA